MACLRLVVSSAFNTTDTWASCLARLATGQMLCYKDDKMLKLSDRGAVYIPVSDMAVATYMDGVRILQEIHVLVSQRDPSGEPHFICIQACDSNAFT